MTGDKPDKGARWRRYGRPLTRLALGLALACGVVFACQDRLIYFPRGDVDRTPAELNLSFEEVTFETADGLALHAWFIPSREERGVVLLNHGNAGNISHRLGMVSLLNDAGLAVFVYDYRGFGNSEGSPDEEGTYLDVEAAWRYLTADRGVPPAKIVVYGRSLGGPIASHIAAARSPGALVLDSTFTSLPDVGQEIYPFLPVRLLSRFEYPTRANLERVRCPVLVIHSPADEVVPFHHGRALYEAAREPKRFLEVRGGHNDNFSISWNAYAAGIDRLVADHLE